MSRLRSIARLLGRMAATAVIVPCLVSYALVAGSAIVSELAVPTNWLPWPLTADGPYRGTVLLEHLRGMTGSSPGRYGLFALFTLAGVGGSEMLRRLWGRRWRGLLPDLPDLPDGDDRYERSDRSDEELRRGR